MTPRDAHTTLRTLVPALLAAAQVLADHGILLSEPSGAIGEQLPPEDAERWSGAVQEYRELYESFLVTLDALDADEDMLDKIAHMMPGRLEDAPRNERAALHRYQQAATGYLVALQRWREADVLSARIRRECVDDLVATQGGSRSSAEKDAAQHPRYTAHKDKCATLADEKADAETRMHTAKAEYDAQRDYTAALIELSAMERARADLEHSQVKLNLMRAQVPASDDATARLSTRALFETRDVLRDLLQVFTVGGAQAAGTWPDVQPLLVRAQDVLGSYVETRNTFGRSITPRRRKNAVDEEALNAEATGAAFPNRHG